MKIYTYGYKDKDPKELFGFALRHYAIVIDCRYSPRGQSGWDGFALRKLMGELYVHAKGFGNVNYRGGPIKLYDPEPCYENCARILKEHPIILLCVCEDYRKCHRTVVATELSKRTGCDVEHLGFGEQDQFLHF